jgi:hypothetical protein
MKTETKLLYARRAYTYALELVKFYTFPDTNFNELYFSLIIGRDDISITPIFNYEVNSEKDELVEIPDLDYNSVLGFHTDMVKLHDANNVWVTGILHCTKHVDYVTLEVLKQYSEPSIGFKFWEV